MIDSLLKEARVKLNDLDLMTFAHGPGSFTGIRLAISAIQGLVISTQIPVLGISSLQNLAQSFYEEYGHEEIAICVNAYMSEVYYGLYRIDEGFAVMQEADKLLKPDALPTPQNKLNLVGIGNAWKNYSDLLSFQPQQIYPDYLPRAASLLKLANSPLLQQKIGTLESLNPCYLRTESAWLKQ